MANLTNPWLWTFDLQFNLFICASLFVVMVVLLSFTKRFPHPWITAILVLFYLLLVLTPAGSGMTSVLTRTGSGICRDPGVWSTRIQWRFGMGLLGYSVVVALVVAEPFLRWLCEAAGKRRALVLALSFLLCLAFPVAAWRCREHLRVEPQNQIILEDFYPRPVGTDGYRSVYDYVRNNIRGSTISTMGSLPYYLYGPGFTNRLFGPNDPGRFLVVARNLAPVGRTPPFPNAIFSSDFQKDWKLIYADDWGRVYETRRCF